MPDDAFFDSFLVLLGLLLLLIVWVIVAIVRERGRPERERRALEHDLDTTRTVGAWSLTELEAALLTREVISSPLQRTIPGGQIDGKAVPDRVQYYAYVREDDD